MRGASKRRTSMDRRSGRPGARGGFTLLETALATVIVGVGVVAMVESQQSFIRSNLWSSHAASGTLLANELRERMKALPKHDPVTGLSIGERAGGGSELIGWGPEPNEPSLADFDDLDDFDGLRLSWIGTEEHADGDLPGPVNAFGEVVSEVRKDGSLAGVPAEGWEQAITVEKVMPFNTSVVIPDGAYEEPRDGSPGRAVDEYPLRVTVDVTYQAPFAVEPELVARVVWVTP